MGDTDWFVLELCISRVSDKVILKLWSCLHLIVLAFGHTSDRIHLQLEALQCRSIHITPCTRDRLIFIHCAPHHHFFYTASIPPVASVMQEGAHHLHKPFRLFQLRDMCWVRRLYPPYLRDMLKEGLHDHVVCFIVPSVDEQCRRPSPSTRHWGIGSSLHKCRL